MLNVIVIINTKYMYIP